MKKYYTPNPNPSKPIYSDNKISHDIETHPNFIDSHNKMEDAVLMDHEPDFLDEMRKEGVFNLAIGAKGSGKTYLMMCLLKYALMNDLFKYIVFVCPSWAGEADDQYAFLENQKHVLIYKHYSEKVSIKVDQLRQKGRTLFLIDDASGELLKRMDNTLIQIITTTRHFKKCTVYIAVHSARKILAPIVRQNINNLFIYKILNMKLLQDIYEEYLSTYFDRFSDFKRWYLYYIKEKHACMHFGLNTHGLDGFVNSWRVVKLFEDFNTFPATKPIEREKPKEDNKRGPVNQNTIKFMFGRRRGF